MGNQRLAFCILVLALCPSVYSERYKVVIIGAGAAGIAAATRLLENGIDRIVILEAEGRLGGRIHSVFFGNVSVDLGAEYCEGQVNNVVYDLVRNLNILRQTETRFELVYSNGTIIEDPQFVADILDFSYLLERKDSLEEIGETSVGEYFMERYDEKILERYKDQDEKLKAYVDALSTLESMILLREGAFSWLKPTFWRHKQLCPGYQQLNWGGAGYKIALEVMMREFPDPFRNLKVDEKIYYRKKVTSIQYGGYNDDRVTVVCDDENYIGEFVIFTPSVGVLKHKHQHMFIPELPTRKRSCIDTLGFDATMKIVLQFSRKWWIGDFVPKAFIWSAEDKVNLAQMFPRGPVKNGESWLSSLKFVLPAVSSSDTLIVYMTGEFIEDIEQAAEDLILDGVMFVLSKFASGGMPIWNPEKMMYTQWYTNDNFHGTRSFETIGSRTFYYNCNEELAKPLTNRNYRPTVLFAGEATSVDHYGTVHGAIESGYREAERILRYYREHQFEQQYYSNYSWVNY